MATMSPVHIDVETHLDKEQLKAMLADLDESVRATVSKAIREELASTPRREELLAEMRQCVHDADYGDPGEAHEKLDRALLAYINDSEITAIYNSRIWYYV